MIERVAAGMKALSDRDLAFYLLAGGVANGLVVVGFPKVGGFLAAMILATYAAAISDGAQEAAA